MVRANHQAPYGLSMPYAIRHIPYAIRLLWGGLLGASLGWSVGAADPVGFEALRLDQLPVLRHARAGQFSSCDRTGGNNDQGHYLATEGATAVLAEMEGPGCLYRIWSANPAGLLRLYFDGERRPRVEVPFQEFLTGRIQPFAPLCSDAGGGGCCYYPFPFQKSCRVTVENAPPLYYQVTYHSFPAGTKVTTYTPGSRVPSTSHAPASSFAFPLARQIAPGETLTLFDSRRPGLIEAFSLRVDPPSLKVLRGLVVRMYWDGERHPSVECPVADFFAAGLGPSEWMDNREFPVVHGAGLTCRFPMPYYRSARLTLTQRTQQTVRIESKVDCSFQPPPCSPPRGRFHAQYREASTVAGRPYVILEAQGRGHYVGAAMVLLGQESLQFLEGDERVYIDGEKEPSLQGTGTEDYFNAGWYFLRGPFATFFAGAPVLQAGKSRVAAYRWQISDTVPFRKNIRVELEHGLQNTTPGCTYQSVAFWYQTEPHVPFLPLPESRPLPPFREAGVIEGEDLEGEKKEIGSDLGLPQQASGGRFARFAWPLMEGQAQPLRLQLPVAQAGVFDVKARLIVGPRGNRWMWNWGKGENGNKIRGKLSTWAPLPGLKMQSLGRVRWAAGTQTITLLPDGFSPESGCPLRQAPSLEVDYLQLEPVFRVKGALEGEDLQVLEVSPGVEVAIDDWTTASAKIPKQWSPHVTGGKRHGPADWSGGAQVRIMAPPQGGRATFALSVPENGEYAVVASFTDAPAGGQAQIWLNGQPLGPSIHTSSESVPRTVPPWGGRAVWEVDHRVGLGGVALKAGSHRLTVEVSPSPEGQGGGSAVGVDYLLLKPTSGGYEGEDLPVLGATAATWIHERFGAEPRWSGGAFLRFEAAQVGDRLTLGVPLFHRGRYELKLGLVRQPGGGQGQLLWDGQPVGAVFDSFSPGAEPATLRIGLVRGKAGLHQLTVEIVGQNEKSAGYEVGLDQVELHPLKPSPLWWKGGAAALAGVVLAGAALGRRWFRRRRGCRVQSGRI